MDPRFWGKPAVESFRVRWFAYPDPDGEHGHEGGGEMHDHDGTVGVDHDHDGTGDGGADCSGVAEGVSCDFTALVSPRPSLLHTLL